MAVTVEELEIVIEAQIQDALSGLETVQKKLMETASKVAPEFNKQMRAVMAQMVEPMQKVQQELNQATQKTSASTKQMANVAAKNFSDIQQKLAGLNAQIVQESKKLNGLMQTFREGVGIFGENHPSLAGIKQEIQETEQLIGNLRTQMLELQKTPVQGPDNSHQMEYAKQAAQSVKQSVERVQAVLESMKQATEQAVGVVAANLENINQKIQAQQMLLDQLRDKFAQAMTSEGMSEKTARIQQQLLGAESAMIKLVDQYNKAAQSAENAAKGTEEIKDKAKGAETSVKKLPNPFLRVVEAVNSIKKGVDKASSSTKKFQQTSKTVTTKVESMFKKLGRAIAAALPFLALAQAFRKFVGFISDGIKSAIDAPEIENMFRVALGNMAAEADKFAKQFKTALGVDEYATKQMLGTFQNMIATMGIGQQTAYKMSKSLTVLANDMASLYNVAPEQAFDNLQSALAGQSRAVRKYGYVLTEAAIKETALRHGIIQQGQELNENQKVLARYLALMEQSTAAQGDMARTIGSVQNQLRILQGNITAAGREIGQAFIPALEAILPWLNAFAIVIQRVGTMLARFTYSLFGRDYDAEKKKQQEALENMGNIAGGLGDVADGEKEVGNEADKAKKKIQNMLAPFDELYVIQQKMDEEKPENPNVPNLEWDVPTLEIPDGKSPLEELADRIMDKLREIFKVFRQAWENEGQNTIDAAKYAFESLLEAIKAVGRSFSEVWNNGTGQEFVENILRLVQIILNIIGDIASAFTIAWESAGAGTALIQQIFDAMNAVLELVISIGNAFREAWNDGRGVEIWDAILSIATNVFAIVENLADRLRAAWEENDNGVKIWGHILDIVQDVLDFLDRITEATANWAAQLDFGPLMGSFEGLLGVIEELVDSILNGLGWAYENVLLPFGTWLMQTAAPAFLDAVAAILGSSVWQDAARSIKDLYENSLKPLAQWTGEKIMDFLNWIKENGDTAANIIIAIGKAFLIWQGIKGINNIATDVLKLAKAVKNSGLVKLVGAIADSFKKMQPAASKATKGVVSAFKNMAGPLKQAASTAFAAMQISGNPFTGLIAGLESAGRSVGQFLQDLNPLAKIGGTLAGVTAEFAIVSNAVENFASGNQGMGETLLKVIPTIGAVGAALYGMLGPAGLVVTAITGIISAFKGVIDANEKMIASVRQKIFDETIYENGGIKISELADAFSGATQSIRDANDRLREVQSQIDSNNKTIQDAEEQILYFGTVSQSTADGISTDDVPRIKAAFDELATGIKANMQLITEQLTIALMNTPDEIKNQLDADIPELVSLIVNGGKEVDERVSSLQEQFGELYALWEQDQSNTALAEQMTTVAMELAGFDQTTQDTVSNFKNSVKELGTIDFQDKPTVLKSLDEIGGAFDESSKALDDSKEKILGWVDTVSKGLSDGESKKLKDFFVESFTIQENDLNEAYATTVNTMKSQILKAAQSATEATGPSLKEMMSVAWAATWSFDPKSAAMREIQKQVEQNIEETVGQPIMDKLSQLEADIPSEFRTFGENISQGAADGIGDNAQSAIDAINNLSSDLNSAMHDGELEFGSPSKKMIEYGKWIIEGLAQGISENAKLLNDALNQMSETITIAIKEQFQIEEYSMVFFNFGMGFMQGLAQGVTEGISGVREAFLAVGEAINTALNEALAVLGGEIGAGNASQDSGQENGNAFYQFGMKLMTGLSQGITDTLPKVLETIQTISEQIIEAFKTAFIIDEFSQVFFDFGVLFIQSLTNGITESMELVQEQIEALKELITELYTDFIAEFSETLSEDLQSVNEIVSGHMDEMVNIVSKAVDEATEEISRLISKINSAIAKAKQLQSIGSSYGVGGSARRTIAYSAEIPAFASGAVLRSPTVGLMAEYAGAASNPEIVTPQNILQETMIDAMFPAVAALSGKLDAVIDAINRIDPSIQIGDDVIYSSSVRGGRNYSRMTGAPAFEY